MTDSANYRTGTVSAITGVWITRPTRTAGLSKPSGRSSDYRADAGFTRRTNTNTHFSSNRFSTKSKPKAKHHSRQLAISSRRYTYDWKGRSQERFRRQRTSIFSLQGNLFIYAEAGIQCEHIYEDEFGAERDRRRQSDRRVFRRADALGDTALFQFQCQQKLSTNDFSLTVLSARSSTPSISISAAAENIDARQSGVSGVVCEIYSRDSNDARRIIPRSIRERAGSLTRNVGV